eukprot:GHVS01077003.1.p2 GENE.GHVS01077003.1~~GHVS01077003.1.p2  ORF type:complete len:111 (+),score=12.17 GHVS01077003.1:120-452(+)
MWPLALIAAGGGAFLLRASLRQLRAHNVDLVAPLQQYVKHIQTRDLRGFDSKMSRTEAYQILHLSPASSKERIREVHKQLMLRNHPDNGGSTYVATKVNEAKDFLLGDKS